jgi:hypothetical protein
MVVLLTACVHEASITGSRSPLESGCRYHTMSFSEFSLGLPYAGFVPLLKSYSDIINTLYHTESQIPLD